MASTLPWRDGVSTQYLLRLQTVKPISIFVELTYLHTVPSTALRGTCSILYSNIHC